MDFKLPICPICKKEVLIPFSTLQHELGSKAYGIWVCSNCGFYLKTESSRGVDLEHYIEAGFSHNLRKKVEELREEYNRQRG